MAAASSSVSTCCLVVNSPSAVTRGHPFIVAGRLRCMGLFTGNTVMHGLDFCSWKVRDFIQSSQKPISFTGKSDCVSSPFTFEQETQSPARLLLLKFSPDHLGFLKQPGTALISPLTTAKDTFKFTSVSYIHWITELPGTQELREQWHAKQRNGSQVCDTSPNVGRGAELMVGCAAFSNAQVGAHNMAAGTISQCVADTKQGAH